MNVLRPNAIADTKACWNARRPVGRSATRKSRFHSAVLQDVADFSSLAQRPARLDLIRGHEAALGKHRLESSEPDFVVTLCKVIRRRPIFARKAPHVDVPLAGPACGEGKPKHPAFPFGMKGRFVCFRDYGTKAMNSAHVMCAIHGAVPSGNCGRPVPIMQSRVTIEASCSSLQPLCRVDAWEGRGTASQRSSPTREFPCRQEVRRRSREARLGGPLRRASGKVPICTKQAEARARATDSRSTAYTRPCCAVWACSPRRWCARLACRHNQAKRAFVTVRQGVSA